jgi:uncharacterized protein (DUF2141 family)
VKIEKKLNSSTTNFLKYIIFGILVLASHTGIGQTLVKKGNLKVVVNNIKSKSGQIGFSLYNSADAFPSQTEKALISEFVKIAGNSVEYTFTNLPLGTYAVSVVHDEDNDKKLKTNFLGMPKEGVGVSNNAKGLFGPPKYNDAKFDFNKSEQTITITLAYL